MNYVRYKIKAVYWIILIKSFQHISMCFKSRFSSAVSLYECTNVLFLMWVKLTG